MSIRNAGKTIKEARLKAGMTQEQLSEGICTVLSLSRIENGSSGVSPVTFQSLMAHAGAPCELYPIFASRTDFDCFYALKRARYFLNSWQLQECYDELSAIEAKSFANNKLYYQEWLYLYGSLLVRSGADNHSDIYNIFSEALHITRPEIHFTDFRQLFLSTTEIELLISIAEETLHLDGTDTCYIISSQIASYLASAELDYLKKDFLEAEYAITYSKYLLYIKDYKEALSVADTHRHRMVLNSEDAPLFELTFLTALGYYYTGETDTAYSYFKNTFYSAHAVESYYATVCRNYVLAHHMFKLDEYLSQMEDIPQLNFPTKKAIDTSDLTDGTYDFFSPDILTIGRLIHEFRREQGLSQIVLCQGLCSKSKLSKIENDLLQPDIFLAEALLQRLGISERVLTFWGNERESELYELKFKLINSDPHDFSLQNELLASFKLLQPSDNIVARQFYLFSTSILEQNPNKCISLLYEALHCTIPDFDIAQISHYRLSWNELSILNNIAHQYRLTNTPYVGSQILQNIIQYCSYAYTDILFSKTFSSISMYMLCRSLYTQKRFQELSSLLVQSPKTIKYGIYTYSFFLFYYCQGLAECGLIDFATRNAVYSCSIQNLFDLEINSKTLKIAFKNDFSVDIIL